MDRAYKPGEDGKTFAQYVKVRMDKEWFGISIAMVENIVRLQRITRVPGSEFYIKGVINLRGKVVPVMSLRLKMGMEEGEEQRTNRIIILKIDGDEIGVIVDEGREVVTIPDEDVEKVYSESSQANAAYLLGVGKLNGNLISILDMYEVLGVKQQ